MSHVKVEMVILTTISNLTINHVLQPCKVLEESEAERKQIYSHALKTNQTTRNRELVFKMSTQNLNVMSLLLTKQLLSIF